MVMPLLFVLVFLFLNHDDLHGKELYRLIWTIIMLELIVLFITYKSLKKFKRLFESFRLTVTEHELIRRQHDAPDIMIARQDVKEIIKAHNGSYGIIGDSKLNAIIVPAHINDEDGLELLLSEIRPMVVKISPPWWQKFLLPITIAGGGCLDSGDHLMKTNTYSRLRDSPPALSSSPASF